MSNFRSIIKSLLGIVPRDYIYLDIETKTKDHEHIRLIGASHTRVLGRGGPLITPSAEELRDALAAIPKERREKTCIVTYYGEGFDYPNLLANGLDVHSMGYQMLDLWVVSKIWFYDRKSHSLDSWAAETGDLKLEVDYDNCDIATLEQYLRQDLHITEVVFRHMIERLLESNLPICSEPLRLEQQIVRHIADQSKRGFYIDKAMADGTLSSIGAEMEAAKDVYERDMPFVIPPVSRRAKVPAKQVKKDGMPTHSMSSYAEKIGCALDVTFAPNRADGEPEFISRLLTKDGDSITLPADPKDIPVHTERLKLDDIAGIKNYLLNQGWEPSEYKNQDGTNPVFVNTETREVDAGAIKILGTALTGGIAHYAVLKARASFLKGKGGSGLIPKIQGDRVFHSADTLGCNTGRYRHRTIVNVPRVSTTWGGAIRSCFVPDPGQVMVGWDASSLEARCEANRIYIFDPDQALELVTGDIHKKNQEALGLPTRDAAKKFKYMVMYGAGPKKIAKSMGVSFQKATEWYYEFWNVNSALADYTTELRRQWKYDGGGKYIKGLDGRPVFTRSEHSLLNARLQSDGAQVMKIATLLVEKRVKSEIDSGICRPLIRYHDEEQWSSHEGYSDTLGRQGVKSIVDAGRYFDFKVPLDGEYKVGKNWAETH